MCSLNFSTVRGGGRPDKDGIDGVASSVVNFSNNPAEVLEAELPLRIDGYSYLPDTGGAGIHRGGLSLIRDFRLLAEEATLQIRAGPHKVSPLRFARWRYRCPITKYLES